MQDTPSTQSSTGAAESHAQGLWLARHRRFDEAAERFEATVQADPEKVEAIRHLAQALSDAGRLKDAESAWLRYIERRPEHADALRHLGNLQKRLEKPDAAIASLERAVGLDGAAVACHIDYAIALSEAKRVAEAKKAFGRALELQPENFDAHLNFGRFLQEHREPEEALKHLRRAVEIRPEDPNGHNNLGVALAEQGKFDQAIECYKVLLERSPDFSLAWNNMGNALRSAGRLEEAKAALEKALQLRPDYAEAHNNLGIIYAQQEQYVDALRSYDRSILLRPEYPEAHANRGLTHLTLGNFQQGWADYEWRWQNKNGLKRRKFPGRVWDGSPLTGKKILLYYEQGLGDTFQFIRYARDLKARGAHVVFECQPHMRQILDRTPGIDEFLIRGEKPSVVDFYAPLLSLPGLCQTNVDNLPRRVPYVFTDPEMIWEWKQRLAQVGGFRVGIVWQGNPEHKGDRARSIPLKCFAPLAAVPGVRLITLQKNKGVEQIDELNGLFPLVDFKGVAEWVDGWLRTAAIVANLDLVIAADTSVIHIAGAMGVPVWAAISTSPDWRWLLERDDTPWYPTMRLFRQHQTGDWDEVFGRIAEALTERVEASDRRGQPAATPVDASDLVNKANQKLSASELSEAQVMLEQAVALDPANAAARQDLGVVYAKQNRLRDAIACFRRALELLPDSPGLYANLGLACFHAGRVEESVSHLRTAVLLGSGSPATHKNLGMALAALPDPAAAEQSYWSALRLQPDDAEAHFQLSRVLLLQGKYDQGWLEQQWRWRAHGTTPQSFDKPRWVGQPVEGKRLLLTADGDVRDIIQLIRYADVLAQQGAGVVVECDARYVGLLSGCLGVQQAVARGERLPEIDFYASLLSVPAIVGTTLDTVPAARPYLGVRAKVADLWRERLGGLNGYRIGLALHGDHATAAAKARDAAMRRELDRLPGATVVDLHDDAPADDETDPLATTAGMVRSVDLVIAVDNLEAHMAGAMAIPCITLLPICPEPRWMLNREDSPWYPTVRLVRQRLRGSWDEAVTRVTGMVCERLRSLRQGLLEIDHIGGTSR